MNIFSNTYIFIFSMVMVVIVAAVVSFASMQLKPFQDRNIEVEKKKNILASLNIESTTKDAEAKYSQYITSVTVLDYQGNEITNPSVEPFYIDLKKELDKPLEKRNLPLFINQMNDSSKNYVIPVHGKGLWGPIWGFVALKEDFNTIYGVTFVHSNETPELGAEIATLPFHKQFIGKKIFTSSGKFQSIKVVKGGADPTRENEVDAVSGGTITSKGLQDMLYNCIDHYVPYFRKQTYIK